MRGAGGAKPPAPNNNNNIIHNTQQIFTIPSGEEPDSPATSPTEPLKEKPMVRTLYTVRDTLAETILGGIQIFITDAQAIRFFGDIAGDKQTAIARHPHDHELIKLGELDESTGTLTAFVAPHVVITGAQWLAAQAPNSPQLALEA